jgi:uncharacterized membrane protein (TIGR02234 family)
VTVSVPDDATDGPVDVPSSRRDLAVAVGLTVIGSALTLLAAGRPWARAVVRQAPLPPAHVALSGRAVAPLAAALGIAALAAVVALLATRNRTRVAVGVVIGIIGAGIVGSAASLSTDGIRHGSALRDRAPAAALRDTSVSVRLEPWRHVGAAGGLIVVAAGLLTVVRGRRWSAMGSRFDAPTAATPATQPTSVDDDVDLWARIDRGDDPTT